MFLDPSKNCSFEEADAVIHQIPYEYSSSYLKGSYRGPSEIIKSSHYVELFDDELKRETITHTKIHTCPPLDINGKFNQEAMKSIQDYVKEKNSKKGVFHIYLGGEHSVSYPIIKHYVLNNKDFGILQIDAHADLRESYQGNKYSHASVMARISELNLPITQVGIRALSEEEHFKISKTKNILSFFDSETQYNLDTWQKIGHSLPKNIYITLDTDGLDPSVFPAVGTPEPGGLKWSEILSLLRFKKKKKNVLAMDVVECCPLENDIRTQYNLAKLIYRVIGYKFGA